MLILTAAIVPALLGQEQDAANGEKLTARQMFYGAEQNTPAPQAKPKAVSRPAPPKPKVSSGNSSSSTPGTSAAPITTTPEERTAPIIRVSDSTTPLGLRYTLRRKTGDSTTDTPPGAVFHSGDHIQLGIEVNEPGYLYLISQGTSGTWNVLFPSPNLDNGDNRVQSRHLYTVPPGGVFTFTGKPGVEKLFVIFSRTPEQDMERLIYSLQGNTETPASYTKPEKPAPKVLLASVPSVDDSLIEQMRAVYSRDLIIEKVDEEKPGEKQDKAVYVVNPKGANSRVVADISLTHE